MEQRPILRQCNRIIKACCNRMPDGHLIPEGKAPRPGVLVVSRLAEGNGGRAPVSQLRLALALCVPAGQGTGGRIGIVLQFQKCLCRVIKVFGLLQCLGGGVGIRQPLGFQCIDLRLGSRSLLDGIGVVSQGGEDAKRPLPVPALHGRLAVGVSLFQLLFLVADRRNFTGGL